MRTALTALAVALGVLTAPTAQADPPCAAYNVCQYMPHPANNGPLMPVWDTPDTNGGWTNLPVLCDPGTYECRQVAPSN